MDFRRVWLDDGLAVVVAARGGAELSTGWVVDSTDGAEGARVDPFVGMPSVKVLEQFGMGSAEPLLATNATGAKGHRAVEGCKMTRKGVPLGGDCGGGRN
jgi:hypothetical protein